MSSKDIFILIIIGIVVSLIGGYIKYLIKNRAKIKKNIRDKKINKLKKEQKTLNDYNSNNITKHLKNKEYDYKKVGQALDKKQENLNKKFRKLKYTNSELIISKIEAEDGISSNLINEAEESNEPEQFDAEFEEYVNMNIKRREAEENYYK